MFPGAFTPKSPGQAPVLGLLKEGQGPAPHGEEVLAATVSSDTW